MVIYLGIGFGEKSGTDPLLPAGIGFTEVLGMGLFVEPGTGLFVLPGIGFLVLRGTGLEVKKVGFGATFVGVGVGLATST